MGHGHNGEANWRGKLCHHNCSETFPMSTTLKSLFNIAPTQPLLNMEPLPPMTSCKDCARLVGSFKHDFKSGGYTLCWENIHEMEVWMLKEEDKNTKVGAI